jgi:hypothetical protein
VVGRAAVALFAGLVLAGCGASSETILAAAGIAEIAGPYRTEPYRAFDPSLIAAVEAECRQALNDPTMVPPAAGLVLADARGGGRMFLMFRGANGQMGECFGTVDATGQIAIEGGGGGGPDDVPPPGPLELGSSSGMASSGGPGGSWTAQAGIVGSEVGGVVIELGDGTQIVATTAGGRYAAWWPGEQSPTRILVYDRSGNFVSEQPS